MSNRAEAHQAAIVDQFSRQATPFARIPGHWDALQTLVELTEVGPEDSVLDVACGPGIVACEMAKRAGRVTGVDVTPAMIDEARKRGEEQGAAVRWEVGEAERLPFADGEFSVVVTRYSFHHMLRPAEALAEMVRVCRPGGVTLVADVAIGESKSAAYDHLEALRDPSHIHALTERELERLFEQSGLVERRLARYGVEIALEDQLAASFPEPGDEAVIRELVVSDVGVDALGINARERNGRIIYTVPIGVFVGRKPVE